MLTTNVSFNDTKFPTAFITKQRQRIKQYGSNTVYLKNGDNFELEFFNPKPISVLATIRINGNLISNNGLIIKPGQRVFLDRFIDTNNKFVYETYEIENSNEAKAATINNGNVQIQFYDEDTNFGHSMLLFGNGTTSTFTQYPNYTNQVYTTTPYFDGSTTISYSSSDSMMLNCSTTSYTETGRVEKGSSSNQKLKESNTQFVSYPFHTVQWKILPESTKPITSDDIRQYCPCCGSRIRKQSYKFCPLCGGKLD